MINRLYKILSFTKSTRTPFQSLSAQVEMGKKLVHAIYYLCIFLSASILYGLGWSDSYTKTLSILLIATQIWVIFGKFSFTSRLCYAVTVLISSYYVETYIHRSHADILAVIVLLIFVLLPKNKNGINQKFNYLTVIMFAQFFTLMIYSVTGFWKIYYGFIQYHRDELSIFSPDAAKTYVFSELLIRKPVSYLGEYVINYTHFFGALLWIIVLIELFSIFIFFKPKWHKPWAFFLLAIHLSTFFSLNILFESMSVIAFAIMFMSPAQKRIYE